MLGLLRWIADALESMGAYVLVGLVDGVNAIITAIGALIGVLVGLLPSIPDPPAAPAAEWIGWLNWIYPLAPALAAATGLLLLYTLLLGLRIALRWVKAL